MRRDFFFLETIIICLDRSYNNISFINHVHRPAIDLGLCAQKIRN